MSAVDILHDELKKRNVNYTTAYDDGGVSHTWWSDGEKEVAATTTGRDRNLLAVYYLTPEQAIEATIGRYVAQRVITSDPSTDCATGRCECGLCKGAINPWDNWCRHCGVRLAGPSA